MQKKKKCPLTRLSAVHSFNYLQDFSWYKSNVFQKRKKTCQPLGADGAVLFLFLFLRYSFTPPRSLLCEQKTAAHIQQRCERMNQLYATALPLRRWSSSEARSRLVWTTAILVSVRSLDPTEAAHLQCQERLRNKAAPHQSTVHTALHAHLLHSTQESIPGFTQSPAVAVSLWEPHWRAVLAVYMQSKCLKRIKSCHISATVQSTNK